MKNWVCLILLCGLLSACAPQKQFDVIDNVYIKVATERQSCADLADEDVKPITAKTICKLDSMKKLLRKDNFKDMDLFDTYSIRELSAAHFTDSKKFTAKKQNEISRENIYMFLSSVKNRDNARLRHYIGAMQAISSGFAEGAANAPQINMPSYAPSCPACEEGARAGQANTQFWQQQGIQDQQNMQSLQDAYHYNNPPPAPPSPGSSRGYNGATGRADTTYVPVDPALTPGLTPDGYAR